MKRGSGKAKGSLWERELCLLFSKWWTSDKNDSVFWRTDSGARAKRRGRKGIDTCGTHGDIVAIDPIGAPLIDLVTIEVKRGYNSFTIFDLMDRGDKAARQKWEEWISQAQESHEQAGSFSWMLIVRRDHRLPIVVIDRELIVSLRLEGALEDTPSPFMTYKDTERTLSIMRLSDFFSGVSPQHIKQLIKKV